MSDIEITGLDKTFQATQVLHGIDLHITNGEFITLLGPSGCGKTTTLRCVAGLEVPSGGSIRIGGKAVADASLNKFVPPHRRNVGMVFQSYAIWPQMTSLSNVVFPLKRRKIGRPSERRSTAVQALEAVGMGAHLKRYPHELSGGQQQRVALARGLVSAGDVMLYDEPLSNLDAKLRVQMREEVRRLHDTYGHTSIYVTHDQEEAFAISDRVVIMKEGRIEQSGTPEDIFGRPTSRYVADFIGYENLFAVDTVEGSTAVLAGGLVVKGAVGAGGGRAIAFRTTKVRLGEGPSDAALVFEARVVRRIFAGDMTEWILQTDGGARVVARIRSGDELALEGRSTFYVERQDVIVMAD